VRLPFAAGHPHLSAAHVPSRAPRRCVPDAPRHGLPVQRAQYGGSSLARKGRPIYAVPRYQPPGQAGWLCHCRCALLCLVLALGLTAPSRMNGGSFRVAAGPLEWPLPLRVRRHGACHAAGPARQRRLVVQGLDGPLHLPIFAPHRDGDDAEASQTPCSPVRLLRAEIHQGRSRVLARPPRPCCLEALRAGRCHPSELEGHRRDDPRQGPYGASERCRGVCSDRHDDRAHASRLCRAGWGTPAVYIR
jgi:hypothetical protein